MVPRYSGFIGNGWLEKGGVWVLSNLRGGGEFGPDVEPGGAARRAPEGLRRLHRGGRGSHRAQGHLAREARHPGRQPGRASRERHDAAAPGALRRGGGHGAAHGHEALPQAARGRLVDGRVRRPGQARGLGLHLEVLALPERAARARRTRRCSSPPRRATTACIPATRARWPRACRQFGYDTTYFEYTEGGHGAGTTPAQTAYTWAFIYTFFAKTLM